MPSETRRSIPFRTRLNEGAARLDHALQRIALLKRSDLAADPALREALLLNLERCAWAALELASIWVIELRLGMPKKPTEAFELLQRAGHLELDEARRLRNLSEYRNLASRPPEAIDWDYLAGDLSADLGAFARWTKKAAAGGFDPPAPES